MARRTEPAVAASSRWTDDENRFLADPQPLGGKGGAPAPDPKLYATYDGSLGEPASSAMGTEKGLVGKVKEALDPDKP
nr:hypothetical protein [Rhodococcus sp. USK13]